MAEDNTSQVGSGQVGDIWVGSGGLFSGQTVEMSAGGDILIAGGAGGVLSVGQVIGAGGAWTGGAILINGGTTAALIQASERNVTLFIQGVDRTEYVELGIRRSVQTGGTAGTLVFAINNGSQARRRADLRPARFDEVLCYVGAYRFFAGFVNTSTEDFPTGTSGFYRVEVNCVSYTAALDYAIVGRHYEIYNGGLLLIILADLIITYLSEWGITFGGLGGFFQSELIEPITFPWISMRQILQNFCARFVLDFYLDMWKILRLFPAGTTANDAPFAIETDNGLWKRMVVENGSDYANSITVVNSAELGSIATDQYTASPGQPLFIAGAALKTKPQVLVDDVAETVVDPLNYSAPWLWYWLPFSVVRNPAFPLAGGEVIKIRYQSDLPWRALAEDAAEIVAHGHVGIRIDVKGAITRQEMQAIADGELARRIRSPKTIIIETDEIGLEPGQRLSVNTLHPPVSA